MNIYKLTEDQNVVIRILDDAAIPRGHRWWDEYEAWRAAGGVPDPILPPTMADVAAALTAAVQAWLDATAQGNGYDSLASCISYAGSTVAQWNDDATAAHAWRDAVWLACFQWQQSAAASPPTTFPTSAQVIAQLPQPEVFGWVTHAPGGIA